MPQKVALALVLFGFASPSFGAWEYHTSHFSVASEVSAEVAVAAAQRLEKVRLGYQSIRTPSGRPVRVLLFRDRKGLSPLIVPDARDPARTRGLAARGESNWWIAVAWDAPGNPWEALAHEYAHLARDERDEPLWFQEGMAEFASRLLTTETSSAIGESAAFDLQCLRDNGWIAWPELMAARQRSSAFGHPNFYAQAWIVVRWLAASRDVSMLRATDFEELLRAEGPARIDQQLRLYVDQLWGEWLETQTEATPFTPAIEAPLSAKAFSAQGRLLESWEFPLLTAELQRDLRRWDKARSVLEILENQYPWRPEPVASRAAVEMAVGAYTLAEKKLRAALRNGSTDPEAHYRYSLLLLRPVEATSDSRVMEALRHIRIARQSDPEEPRFLLTEGQAAVLGGLWGPAAAAFAQLRRFEDWVWRADIEFAELLRRRQQRLRAVAAPAVPFAPSSQLQVVLLPVSLPSVARPAPPPLVWPPPGTILVYGYIRDVECRQREKIITVRTPRFTFRFRERAASPAKLYSPPRKLKELPCGMRGYEVNVVYRPLPKGEETRGDLVAVVF